MRRDFSIRFADFGGIRAIVIGETETVAFLPDLDGPLPPVRHVVVGDDARGGQRTVVRETFPNGRPAIERTVHYVDEHRMRVFATELAVARGEGSWLTFDGLHVVNYVLSLFTKHTFPGPPALVDATITELWQAVIAAPDEDAPRLVLADHLIAHGDPRGELITVQCALENQFDLELSKRRDLLVRATSPQYAGAAPFMRRGFVEALEIGTRDAVRNHGRMNDVGAVLAILHDRELQTARRLVLEDVALGASGARVLRTLLAGLLANVRRLRIVGGALADAGADALADAPLERLELPGNAITTVTSVMPTVKWLDLSHNRVATLPHHLDAVECLWLTGNPSAAGLAIRAPQLALLDVGRCAIADLRVLDTPILGQLRYLSLDGNPVSDLSVLVAAPRPQLQTLSVQHCNLTDAAIRVLCAQRDKLPALAKVLLDGNPVTRDARDALREAFGERIQLY